MKDNKPKRKCGACEKVLSIDLFSPSMFNFPAHYNVKCRSCLSVIEKAKTADKRLTVETGYVYVVTNKAWPEWCKIGISIVPKERLQNYNTSSPCRVDEMPYLIECKGYKGVEERTHKYLSSKFDNGHEWFKLPVKTAISAIEGNLNAI